MMILDDMYLAGDRDLVGQVPHHHADDALVLHIEHDTLVKQVNEMWLD